MRRIIITVRPAGAKDFGRGWIVGSPTEHRLGESMWRPRKSDAVAIGMARCKSAASAGYWTQLRVYGPRGLQYERTYPRDSDPKRSKG